MRLDDGLLRASASSKWQLSLLAKLEQIIVRAGFTDAQGKTLVRESLIGGADLKDDVEKEYYHSYAQALAILLVTLSPNLESMALYRVRWQWNSKSFPTMFYDFMKRAVSSPGCIPYLQKLRTIDFIPESPSPTNVDCPEFYEMFDCGPPLAVANYSSISITNCTVDTTTWRSIIAMAKRLEKVVFTTGGRDSADGPYEIHPHAIFGSLLWHRNSLAHLDLDIEGSLYEYFLFSRDWAMKYGMLRTELEEVSADHQHTMHRGTSSRCNRHPPQPADWLPEELLPMVLKGSSFRDFTKLKHLGIGVYQFYYFALGVGCGPEERYPSLADGLPESLESLRIYGYDKGAMEKKPQWLNFDLQLPDLDPHIARFLVEKDSKLPRLKLVEGLDECIPNAPNLWRG
ncbi:hypothetical protein BJY04DRAFT_217034 [Aspergillus karnatakaensis]|uniref:uncharacterized protein n=1 Tax=Aspergillus karnatakaensis TaxID=1810916 RepID=UPI003CCC9E3C